MTIKQTEINHLIKTLAEQLRELDGIKESWEQGVLISMACKAASKTVAQLENLGVDVDEAYDKAGAFNLRYE